MGICNGFVLTVSGDMKQKLLRSLMTNGRLSTISSLDTCINQAAAWGLFQHPIRRRIVRSHEVSKLRDWLLSHRFEIWQAPRQQCCRGACQFSERLGNSNYKYRGFESSRDLAIRRLIRYWNRALISFWIGGSSNLTRNLKRFVNSIFKQLHFLFWSRVEVRRGNQLYSRNSIWGSVLENVLRINIQIYFIDLISSVISKYINIAKLSVVVNDQCFQNKLAIFLNYTVSGMLSTYYTRFYRWWTLLF